MPYFVKMEDERTPYTKKELAVLKDKGSIFEVPESHANDVLRYCAMYQEVPEEFMQKQEKPVKPLPKARPWTT